jgi:N6-adenosine-specific RNA methylase IME4
VSRGKTVGPLFTVGHFAVTGKGLVVDGQPTSAEWAAAFAAISKARNGTQWAIGDMLLFADLQQFDDGLVEATMEATGLKRGTLHNMKSVARTFPARERSSSLSWSHHSLIAGFDETERQELMARARRDKLSYEELKVVTRDMRREQRVREMSWPTGTYGLILADPPWPYEEGAVDPTRDIGNQYPPMEVEAIKALAPRVRQISAPDAVLYLWATSAMMVSGEAVATLQAWGFNGRSMHVWVKDRQGMGYWARQRHEHVIIATCGSPIPPEESLRPDSVITADRGMHSEKPAELYEVLERCYLGVPRVELFARGEPRDGWAVWGNAQDVEEGPRGIRLREADEAAAVTA